MRYLIGVQKFILLYLFAFGIGSIILSVIFPIYQFYLWIILFGSSFIGLPLLTLSFLLEVKQLFYLKKKDPLISLKNLLGGLGSVLALFSIPLTIFTVFHVQFLIESRIEFFWVLFNLLIVIIALVYLLGYVMISKLVEKLEVQLNEGWSLFFEFMTETFEDFRSAIYVYVKKLEKRDKNLLKEEV